MKRLAEVSSGTTRDWLNWSIQLRNVKVPKNIARGSNKMKGIHHHVFADASNIVCSAATVAVVEHSTGVMKGFLTSKAIMFQRNTLITRLELGERTDGCKHGKDFTKGAGTVANSTISVNLWMDNMVVVFWICNPAMA